MLTKTRKPEIKFGRKMFDAKPTAPATKPITKPTMGQRKKYLDIISIDSIPMGTIVKKPNKPFKLLITNHSTFNSDVFCPEEHMFYTLSFKFVQEFTPERRHFLSLFWQQKAYTKGYPYKPHLLGEKEGISNVLVKIHDGKRTT